MNKKTKATGRLKSQSKSPADKYRDDFEEYVRQIKVSFLSLVERYGFEAGESFYTSTRPTGTLSYLRVPLPSGGADRQVAIRFHYEINNYWITLQARQEGLITEVGFHEALNHRCWGTGITWQSLMIQETLMTKEALDVCMWILETVFPDFLAGDPRIVFATPRL